MRASLLVELHTEELPPRALRSLSEAFATGIEASLYSRHFLTSDSRVTPFGCTAPPRGAHHRCRPTIGGQALQAEADAARGRARCCAQLDAGVP